MSNTGTEIVLTLKQVISGSNIPTGLTKPDLIGDPNYIAPYTNLTNCPITYNTSCPLVAGTSGSGVIEFEFSLPNSVVNNPGITKVTVTAVTGSTVDPVSASFTLPNTPPNYFHFILTELQTTQSYTLNVNYWSGSSFVRSCSISGAIYKT
jgi:hypothetical protein